jgi:peroxiredoxin/outer membrane lipoprotein-sorting protein
MTGVWRFLICGCMLAVPACAEKLTARQVLDQVAATYSNLKAVHILAEREETTYPAGRAQSTFSECELANAPGGRYLARLKKNRQQALTVSDGTDIWLALDSKKQWSRISATDDSDEEHDAKAASGNLHDSLEDILLNQFVALAKTAQGPAIAKQQDFQLGRGQAQCYLIRAHNNGSEIELLVDRERFVVLQYKESSKPPETQSEISITLKLVELNREVGDSLFHFEPDPQWTEVETPVPPGRGPIQPGERAADFRVQTLDGESVALESLRGSVVVLDFWATWCLPCLAEFPALEKLRSEFGDAVRVYGVTDESPATVKKFVEEHPFVTPTLLDSYRKMHRRYGVHKIPALFVIDRNSVVRRQFTGTCDESELREAIRAVVDRPAPSQ